MASQGSKPTPPTAFPKQNDDPSSGVRATGTFGVPDRALLPERPASSERPALSELVALPDGGPPLSHGSVPSARLDPRIHAAWLEWLSALATNAEAAVAAAQVYGELGGDARTAWLDALDEDGPRLGVPKVALYAPLLSVEVDAERLARIQSAVANELPSVTMQSTRALRGIHGDRSHVAILIAPLYMEFVQVLWCRYTPHRGFTWVKYDPLRSPADAPAEGTTVDDVELEATPLKIVVEELALAILAQRRQGEPIPGSIALFANLFDARADDIEA